MGFRKKEPLNNDDCRRDQLTESEMFLKTPWKQTKKKSYEEKKTKKKKVVKRASHPGTEKKPSYKPNMIE